MRSPFLVNVPRNCVASSPMPSSMVSTSLRPLRRPVKLNSSPPASNCPLTVFPETLSKSITSCTSSPDPLPLASKSPRYSPPVDRFAASSLLGSTASHIGRVCAAGLCKCFIHAPQTLFISCRLAGSRGTEIQSSQIPPNGGLDVSVDHPMQRGCRSACQ